MRKPHSFDANARANLDAWRRGEAVPSTFYAVGRLVIPRRVLNRAIAEVDQIREFREAVDIHRTGEVNWGRPPEDISPFMQSFLITCARRLQAFVLQDTRTVAPNANFFVTAAAGPYWHSPDEDDWHQDIPHRPLGRKYFVTAHGSRTRFATGSHSADQFDREMFRGTILENEITEAPPRVITLHNEATTVHAAPDRTHMGESRITVDCSFNPGIQA